MAGMTLSVEFLKFYFIYFILFMLFSAVQRDNYSSTYGTNMLTW